MPEIKEGFAQGDMAEDFHQSEPQEEQIIKAIYVDATNPEQGTHPEGSLAHSGQVYELQADSQIVRGQNDNQTLVYPPKFTDTPLQNPQQHISRYELKLTEIQSHPRNVIFKFRDRNEEDYWLQVGSTLSFFLIALTLKQ